MTFFSD